ncbi:MAG: hypothetical protein IJ827_04520 [Lachnospiraceae bacterium]|nr:hypothetical protein [Lachnospiraceae bacterium]
MKKAVFIVLTALCITGCGAAGTDAAHSGDDTLSAVDKVLQERVRMSENSDSKIDDRNTAWSSKKSRQDIERNADRVRVFGQSGVAAEDAPQLTDEEVAFLLGKAGARDPRLDEPLPESDVDIDLTLMSSTMVYSQVLQMMMEPQGFVGKTVRMEGEYNYFHSDENGKDYFACIVQDATACCAQGIEFMLDDTYRYPEDYPEDFAYITVSGTFSTYEEDGMMYCTLLDAKLE